MSLPHGRDSSLSYPATTSCFPLIPLIPSYAQAHTCLVGFLTDSMAWRFCCNWEPQSIKRFPRKPRFGILHKKKEVRVPDSFCSMSFLSYFWQIFAFLEHGSSDAKQQSQRADKDSKDSIVSDCREASSVGPLNATRIIPLDVADPRAWHLMRKCQLEAYFLSLSNILTLLFGMGREEFEAEQSWPWSRQRNSHIDA